MSLYHMFVVVWMRHQELTNSEQPKDEILLGRRNWFSMLEHFEASQFFSSTCMDIERITSHTMLGVVNRLKADHVNSLYCRQLPVYRKRSAYLVQSWYFNAEYCMTSFELSSTDRYQDDLLLCAGLVWNKDTTTVLFHPSSRLVFISRQDAYACRARYCFTNSICTSVCPMPVLCQNE